MKIKKIFIFLLVVLTALLIRFYILPHYFSMDSITSHTDFLYSFIARHSLIAAMFYMLLHIIVVSLSIPLVAISTIIGGYFLGFFTAAICTIIGATVGSIIAFLLFRYLFGNSVQEKYKARLDSFNKSMQENGSYYLLSIHFIAAIPLSVVNILASLTNVSLWTFIWTTALGILPVSLVLAYTGATLCSIESTSQIFSPQLIGSFLLLAVFALTPALYKKFKK